MRRPGAPAISAGRPQQGASLIELVVVMALLAVMVAATQVDWPAMLRPQQSRHWMLQAQQSLMLLRGRALRDGEDITVCAAQADAPCSARWQGDWQAFVDRNGDQRWQADEPRHVLTPSLPAGWHVHWQSFRRDPVLIWRHAGDAGFSNGTLTLCPPRPQDAALMQLVISRSGRLRLVVPRQTDAATLQAARMRCGWSG